MTNLEAVQAIEEKYNRTGIISTDDMEYLLDLAKTAAEYLDRTNLK